MQTIRTLFEILMISTRLGLTSFGGPIAHLGYFHNEYVQRRKWLDEQSYSDLVAVSQFLPGPASSQVGIGIGVMRGGVLGGIVSFLGFTMPSVIALILFAYATHAFDMAGSGFIHGLKIVAVVIVAHAILGMAKNLTPDVTRKAIALVALVASLFIPHFATQVGVILAAGLTGYFLLHPKKEDRPAPFKMPITKAFGASCLTVFFGLLVLLPIMASFSGGLWITMIDSFYRAGSLVFGGGHVVLPLLEREFVPTGLISEEAFLAGYGAAQAVPGPLFTFASFIGADIAGWTGGLVATLAIFLPAFLLILGVLPFWHALRSNQRMKGAFAAVNAAVVGILIAAFYQPIWTSAILGPVDFALASLLFFMLMFMKCPPWLVVVTGALGGFLLQGL